MATSKKDASLASKQLSDNSESKPKKSVAGSDLAGARTSPSTTSAKDAS
ncbi:MAG: hypothetical protein JWM76_2186, partial [Pseudonocardiales bacterium]|nr:hypothetical protein [Pseudonocardiales bacterium]